MTFEAAVVARLLAAPDVTAIVGQLVDWDRSPQGAGPDRITIHLIADPRPQTFAGAQRTRPTMIQVDCRSGSKSTAIALRNAVIAALTPAARAGGVTFQRAVAVRVRADFARDQTDEIYRESVDVTLWHDAHP